MPPAPDPGGPRHRSRRGLSETGLFSGFAFVYPITWGYKVCITFIDRNTTKTKSGK